jgi:electron transport complex protein RnfD
MSAKPTATALPIGEAGPRGFLVSSPPHLATSATTQRIMFEVLLALVPLFGFALYFYHLSAITLTVATCAGCLTAEVRRQLDSRPQRHDRRRRLGDRYRRDPRLLAAALAEPLHGLHRRAIGIGLGKTVFGGLGNNLFNPAMVGRAFLMICFPAALVSWTPTAPMAAAGVDATSMATPLYAAAKGLELPPLRDLFIGNVGGCLGETSTLAALLGGLYLVIRGVADWRQPLAVLVTVFLFALISSAIAPGYVRGPLVPPHQRRPDVRRVLHRDRLRRRPGQPLGTADLRCGRRPAGHGDPALRRVPGGRHVRDPDHELAHTRGGTADHADPVRRTRALTIASTGGGPGPAP